MKKCFACLRNEKSRKQMLSIEKRENTWQGEEQPASSLERDQGSSALQDD